MVKVGRIDDPVWRLRPGDDADERHFSWGKRALMITIVAVVGIVLLYPLWAAVLSRKDYGTFAFWKTPNRINYCGRRYYDGRPVVGSPSYFAAQDGDRSAHWTFLSWTFSGRSIYADVSSNSAVCTSVLYIPIGGGKWEAYGLSGGP